MQSIGVFCATVAYCGRFPVAPGTVGSGAGLIVYSLIRMSGSSFIGLAVILVLWMVGVWASTISEKYFETVDPGPVVIDEVVGMLVTLIFLPVGWIGVVVGFLFFRLFDIFKPFPISSLEQLPGGWGIMADDIAAGIYAHISLWFLLWLSPEWIGRSGCLA